MHKVALRRSMAFGLGGLLVACSATPPPVRPAVVEAPPPAPSPLLFWQTARGLAGSRLIALSRQYMAQTDPDSRLRLAMALAAPLHPERDEVRAIGIADEIAQMRDAPPATREAAAWFSAWLTDSRRNDLATRRTQADAKRIEQLEARVRDSEKRASEAEHKLDALKQIDREMTERPSGRAARP